MQSGRSPGRGGQPDRPITIHSFWALKEVLSLQQPNSRAAAMRILVTLLVLFLLGIQADQGPEWTYSGKPQHPAVSLAQPGTASSWAPAWGLLGAVLGDPAAQLGSGSVEIELDISLLRERKKLLVCSAKPRMPQSHWDSFLPAVPAAVRAHGLLPMVKPFEVFPSGKSRD